MTGKVNWSHLFEAQAGAGIYKYSMCLIDVLFVFEQKTTLVCACFIEHHVYVSFVIEKANVVSLKNTKHCFRLNKNKPIMFVCFVSRGCGTRRAAANSTSAFKHAQASLQSASTKWNLGWVGKDMHMQHNRNRSADIVYR